MFSGNVRQFLVIIILVGAAYFFWGGEKFLEVFNFGKNIVENMIEKTQQMIGKRNDFPEDLIAAGESFLNQTVGTIKRKTLDFFINYLTALR